MPRVSIGMPVYNGEEFIAEAIDSILNQSFTDFELLIADNASTDRSSEICREFSARDRRIRLLPSLVNRGAAWNFNRLFLESKGEYFKWAAVDDICSPSFLQKCVDVLDNDLDVVLCHCHTSKIDAKSENIGQWDWDNSMDVANPAINKRFRTQILAPHNCVHVFGLIRRAILAKTSLIGSYVGSDRVLLAELSLYGPSYVIPEYLFANRRHEENSVQLKRTELTEWFDMDNKGKTVLHAWRFVGGLGMSILRAQIGPKSFLQCSAEILRYCKYKRAGLGENLRYYARSVKKRVVGGMQEKFAMVKK